MLSALMLLVAANTTIFISAIYSFKVLHFPAIPVHCVMASQMETGNVHMDNVRDCVSKCSLFEVEHHTQPTISRFLISQRLR